MKKIKVKKQNGITLIALVITIMVLLILAGVSIATLTGDRGLITKANKSKEDTIIAEEKEIVNLATVQAIGKDKNGNIEEENLKQALDNLTGNGKTTVSTNEDYFEIEFKESKRKYKVDKNGNLIVDVDELPEVADEFPGDITDNGENTGTTDKPYKIYCVEDYIAFVKESRNGNTFEGKYIEIKNSLDFANVNSYVDPNNTIYGDFNQNGKTEPLIQELTTGRGQRNMHVFEGILDGENNTLYNFHMQDELSYDSETDIKDNAIGIIEQNNGTIKNLNVTGTLKCDINKDIHYIIIGGIAAENKEGAIIENCTSNIEILLGTPTIERDNEYTTIRVGGITGYNKGTINKCIYNGKIEGTLNIKATSSYGDTTRLGGITGENKDKVINCINNGILNIKKEYIEGDSETYNLSLGGITAKNNDEGIIENCINTGSIQGVAIGTEIGIAGIAAESEDLTTCIITNVFNLGEISGKATDLTEVGGILGEGYGVLKYGYNTGEIEGASDKNVMRGAIIGKYKDYASQSSFTNCIYNKIGDIYGTDGKDVAGITPQTNLTSNQVINIMNNNIIENNNNPNKKFEWMSFKIQGNDIAYK